MAKERKVDLVVDSDDLNPEDKYKVVFINGVRYQIMKDKEVEVNPIIKDVLKESRELLKKGNKSETLKLD